MVNTRQVRGRGGREGEEKVKMGGKGGKGVILGQSFLRIWVCCFLRFRFLIPGEFLTFGFYTSFYPSVTDLRGSSFAFNQISCF